MKCPACSAPLFEVKSGEVLVDVCKNACGGVWFDAKELDKLDEEQEAVPHQILRPIKNANVAIDFNRKRECPRCAGKALTKSLHDEHYQLELDECQGCGGIWLDKGELERLTVSERRYFNEQMAGRGDEDEDDGGGLFGRRGGGRGRRGGFLGGLFGDD